MATVADVLTLTTITNPTPAENNFFGSSVAAVGSDRLLVGGYGDNTGAPFAGAAYLLSTDGNLITTFTNPTPAFDDWFGSSVASVGNDLVLIGAYADNTGAPNAGAVYLFSTDGTLLTTFISPTPESDGEFGRSVVAVGNDRVLIGAYRDDTGARTDRGGVSLQHQWHTADHLHQPHPGGQRLVRLFAGGDGEQPLAHRRVSGRHGRAGCRGCVSLQHRNLHARADCRGSAGRFHWHRQPQGRFGHGNNDRKRRGGGEPNCRWQH
ncbi:MAG: hypothetical protein HC841_09660 [Verrucomicrobiae bacterium]|nr:hypothetical protein [Verrucomicrobiae bacterium]